MNKYKFLFWTYVVVFFLGFTGTLSSIIHKDNNKFKVQVVLAVNTAMCLVTVISTYKEIYIDKKF